MPSKLFPIYERLENEFGSPASFSAETKEKKGGPEARAEELYALWRDYRRPAARGKKEQSEKLRQAIAERWRDPKVQEIFKAGLDRSLQEKAELEPTRRNYHRLAEKMDEAVKHRDEIYRQIFARRRDDPDELTQMELAETVSIAQSAEKQMAESEKADPKLAAELSFERLKKYHSQLEKGFIWTPSREKYFAQILEHLVILDQNRPLLLYGETGTGKTRLARALSERLTGRAPYEVGEEAKTDIRPLLGSKSIERAESYVAYGPLGQALTGKESSRDPEPKEGGLFYMDEMNGYPADGLRSLIKQLAGRRPGEEVSFAAWAGKREKVAPEFGFIGSANLPSEKHPDREKLPVEVARELSSLEIDYPPQSAENPELYEMMLAALMDKNGRVRISQEELAPNWKPIIDANEKTKEYKIDESPEAGGALWRFANFVSETQKSYKGQDNVLTPAEAEASYLHSAVLDPGLVLAWLAEYRKSAARLGGDLQSFLAAKVEAWGSQKIYPEEDRNLLKKFREKFNLAAGAESPRRRLSVFTPAEIGALSPRVPKQAVELKHSPGPEEYIARAADGANVPYRPASLGEFAPGARLVKKGVRDNKIYEFKGVAKAEGQAVLEEDGAAVLVAAEELSRLFEKIKTKEIIIPNAVNPYREALLAGGVPENQAPERKEIRIDLKKQIQEDLAAYRSDGLESWATALDNSVNKLDNLSEAKRKIIEAEIKDGAIPIFMPGHDTQLQTTIKQIKESFKPVWIKDGKTESPNDAHLWDYFEKLFIGKAQELVADVPSAPYIQLTEPSQRPLQRTTEKILTEQQQELVKINQERQAQNRQPVGSINPYEYLALQKLFTQRTRKESPQALTNLNGIDKDTYIRFINLPLSPVGNAPGGYWYPGNRQVKLGRSHPGDRDSNGGFRLSVRVEI